MLSLKKNRSSIIHKIFLKVFVIQIFSFIVSITGLVIDGLIISNLLGSNAVEAFQYVSPILSIVFAFASLLSSGISIICGHATGSTNTEKVNRAIATGLVIGFVFSSVCTVIILTCAPYITFALGARGQVQELASLFLRGFAVGIIPIFLSMVLVPLLQINGNWTLIYIGMVALPLINVVISLLSTLVFFGNNIEMKIFFIALANSVSYIIALIALLLSFFRKKNSIKRISFKSFDPSLIKDLIIYGLPSSVSQLFMIVSTLSLNYILTSYEGAVAAYGIVSVVNTLMLVFSSAISETIAILSGILLGEEDSASLEELIKIAFVYSVLFNGLVIIVACFASQPVINLLLNHTSYSQEQINLAIWGIKIYSFGLILSSVNSVMKVYYLISKKIIICCAIEFIQFVLILPLSAFILSTSIGVYSVFFAKIIGEVGCSLAIIGIVMFKNKRVRLSIRRLLLLPSNFAKDVINSFSGVITDLEDVASVRDQIIDFCRKNNADERQTFWIALAVEETATNALAFNHKPGHRSNVIVEVKLIEEKKQWRLRLRDNGKLFNPTMYTKRNDSVSHFGIRLILSKANKAQYISTLHLNNLLLSFKKW